MQHHYFLFFFIMTCALFRLLSKCKISICLFGPRYAMCYLADIKKLHREGYCLNNVWDVLLILCGSFSIHQCLLIQFITWLSSARQDSRICWINILCHGVIWFPCQIRHWYDQPLQYRNTCLSTNNDICLLFPTLLASRGVSVDWHDCCTLLKTMSVPFEFQIQLSNTHFPYEHDINPIEAGFKITGQSRCYGFHEVW